MLFNLYFLLYVVAVGPNCCNIFVNKCSTVESYESVYFIVKINIPS
jgi:hypothetical protein